MLILKGVCERGVGMWVRVFVCLQGSVGLMLILKVCVREGCGCVGACVCLSARE